MVNSKAWNGQSIIMGNIPKDSCQYLCTGRFVSTTTCIFYPTGKGCWGIVFTHGGQAAGKSVQSVSQKP